MGMIFDLLRFSLNDGPGIRTTVFLKGCPLRCLWCHNPESQRFEPQLSYDASRCIECGQCAVCPENAHIFRPEHEVDFSRCKACGLCVSKCPAKALKIYGYEATADEIIKIAVRDKAYYETSGGGITVSGGEPLAQPKFTLEILKKAKDENLHTAVETGGYAATEVVADIMPFTDLFLYDYKAEGHLHKKLTGVENALITQNLKFLCEHGANVILRCPIVPGANENPDALNSLVKTLPQIKSVELLPYHNLGVKKARNIGKTQREF